MNFNPKLNSKEQLIDGINLSKKEFASVSVVVKNMAKKFGESVFEDEKALVEEFKIQMRQVFDVHIVFEKIKTKDEVANIPTHIIACRFAKKRPLIFLIYETDNKTWVVLDEKRFPILEEVDSPYKGVSI